MGGPVHERINQITCKKSGEETIGQIRNPHNPECQVEDPKEDQGHDQARNGGHQQPFFVPGVLVVRPVHDKMEPLRPAGFSDPMEHEAMEQVFGKRPEQNSS